MNSQDFEIVDIIVMELVNEADFAGKISSDVTATVHSYSHFTKLKMEICSISYTDHTYNILGQKDDIQTVVAVEILKHYWENYSNKEFDTEVHIPNNAHDLYIKHPKKETEPKKLITANTEEIELRVLSKYADLNVKATEKVNSIFERNRTVNEIIEYFKCYKQGRWAWNTLRGKLDQHIINIHFHMKEEDAIVNLFLIKIYQKIFKKELYQRDFTHWDIPPQCRYLYPQQMFNVGVNEFKTYPTKMIIDFETNQIQGRILRQCAFGKKALFEASERRFLKQFKPEKENTMLDIKNVTLIDGDDAEHFDNDQIFTMIAQVEKEIEKLQSIKATSKALEKKTESHKASITKLIEILDARD